MVRLDDSLGRNHLILNFFRPCPLKFRFRGGTPVFASVGTMFFGWFLFEVKQFWSRGGAPYVCLGWYKLILKSFPSVPLKFRSRDGKLHIRFIFISACKLS